MMLLKGECEGQRSCSAAVPPPPACAHLHSCVVSMLCETTLKTFWYIFGIVEAAAANAAWSDVCKRLRSTVAAQLPTCI